MKLLEAAKRINGSKVSWPELQSRVPITDNVKFLNFKAKSTKYLSNMNNSPPVPPVIDWEKYKNKLGKASWIDAMRSTYDSFEVPFPTETVTEILTKERAKTEEDIKAYKAASDKKIAYLESEITRIKNIMPFEKMTMEDYINSYPDDGPNFITKPTFWPHTPEEQPNAVRKPVHH